MLSLQMMRTFERHSIIHHLVFAKPSLFLPLSSEHRLRSVSDIGFFERGHVKALSRLLQARADTVMNLSGLKYRGLNHMRQHNLTLVEHME